MKPRRSKLASVVFINREIKLDVTWSYVKRQTAKMTSEFVFFSSDPSFNHIKIEKCLLLFATNTNIFTLLFKQLKTDGKSFIFDVRPRNVKFNLSNNLQRAVLLTSFWRHRFNNFRRVALLTSLIQYGEDSFQIWFEKQQLVMVNYACCFNQSETGKYFKWIIIVKYQIFATIAFSTWNMCGRNVQS